MADITLRDIAPDVLVRFGDEAIRAGNPSLALGLYRAAWSARPNIGVYARFGLLRRPTSATPKLIDALQSLEAISPGSAFLGEGLATWGKSIPPLESSRFRELEEKYSELLPLPNWQWNLSTIIWAAQQARNLPGDFVELGVYRGHTTIITAEFLDFATWPKRWLLYDTFDGIPDDQLDDGWAQKNNELYKNTFTYGEVCNRFSHIPNIRVIQGRVPEILYSEYPDRISFLHIDLNNAKAEISALDILFDRMTPGGIIVFDDYCWSASRAQYVAERQWFEERGLAVMPMPTGQGVFVKSPG